MLQNRLIAILLVFVFILQLVPFRQGVRYFWVGNITLEEVFHFTKSLANPPPVTEEDHLMCEIYTPDHPGLYILSIPVWSDPVHIVRLHAAEVETPPPNIAFY